MRRRKHRPATGTGTTPAGGEADRRQVRLPGASGGWLWGRHAVLAAVANPRRRLDRLVVVDDQAAVLDAVLSRLPASVTRPKVECADRRLLAALLPSDAVHQGFAALARPLAPAGLGDLSELTRAHQEAAADLLLVVLDQVTDPRNVGAVLRSAQAFGAAAVVVQDRHAPEEGGALAKAASGALEAVPLIRVTNLARTLRALQDDGVRCIGLAGEATDLLDRQPLDGPLALVLGAEGTGLRRLVREACDALVRIPIAPSVDSLNLSAAAAVALYACTRRRLLPAAGDHR